MAYYFGILLDFVISLLKKYGGTAVFSYLFITFRSSLFAVFLGIFLSLTTLISRFVNILLEFANLFNSVGSSSNDCSVNILFAVLSAIGFTDAFNNFIPVFIGIGISFFSLFIAILTYKFAIFVDKTITSFVLVHK
ncbi:hypothetical protein [Arcobacter porcinus]|uniref:Uncharacterized protein n=1 Tax=Arcobacter porcinus TaxID=1935204 RepID=A0A5C2HGS7_9BACT|nr:hypothetical protein [Arcobacter porcinus]OCL91382.1 hypothetical protein AAX27_01329 [Aliarcobacter thereius]QEP40302.1 hypothetical protein APORC_0687 [Arcobacter porcinus]